MRTENARNDYSSVVARIFRGETCFGTGFLVHSDRVLTCLHVTERDRDKLLRVRLNGGGFEAGVVEAKSEAHDLALIPVSAQEARTPVCFLIGLKTHHENALRKLNWQAIGYNLRDSETFLSVASVCREPAFQWDNKTGTLLDVQVNLGLPAGFSGGPVFIETRGKTLCLGISTLGGEDRDKSRIRLADCIVGFLKESGLAVESRDANEVLGPKEIPAVLAQQQAISNGVGKRNRFWRWMATIGLPAAAFFAGLYLFLKPAPNVIPPRQQFVEPDQKRVSGTPALPFYKVQIMMYSSATPPQLYVNKKRAKLDGYDGRTATLRLHPGSYQVEADYIDRICTAIVPVTGDLSTEAECHLK